MSMVLKITWLRMRDSKRGIWDVRDGEGSGGGVFGSNERVGTGMYDVSMVLLCLV